jgi:D-tagatose-1,6-bisphosphate aldolase subunit GatZ/KbaZ
MDSAVFSSSLPLREKIHSHRSGLPVGIFAVCSSHADVLRAAMRLLQSSHEALLIEATCNQVNQEGGYTGMTPHLFCTYVYELAKEENFPCERILLGGDHLGPNPWRALPAELAMQKSEQLVRAYAAAGFVKIHLDASMPCGGEKALSVAEIAARSARLCAACEQAAFERPAAYKPLYVIGTEVPAPGGINAQAPGQPHITQVSDVAEMLAVHRQIFLRFGLADALERVIAVVVSPGVEFGNRVIFPFRGDLTGDLSSFIERQEGMVYEAHSTDYQSSQALRSMVDGHFAILKVGPALTFALREALFNLAAIENELPNLPASERSRLVETLLETMRGDPRYWQDHYRGSTQEVLFAMKYSFSDRVRYYWGYPQVQNAIQTLIANLRRDDLPLALVSQFFPALYPSVFEGVIPANPRSFIQHAIINVLAGYSTACG